MVTETAEAHPDDLSANSVRALRSGGVCCRRGCRWDCPIWPPEFLRPTWRLSRSPDAGNSMISMGPRRVVGCDEFSGSFSEAVIRVAWPELRFTVE